jgi:acetolactate synthase I/II/III large subunit
MAGDSGMTMVTGGQALVGQLIRHGVRHVFGVPGVQLDWAVDAFCDVRDQIELLVPRHEQATSYMADGYARTTGAVGVCMMVPGPGVLNAMSGLATGYACSAPILCIAGQIASPGIGQGFGMLHEVNDQSGMLANVTKWSGLARTPQDVARMVRDALHAAESPRTRPTAVEVPPDVLQAKDTVELQDLLKPGTPAAPEAAAIERAAALLNSARFPAIYAGGGVVAANASQALTRLAEKIGAPVVMSENGLGAISARHDLALPNLAGRALLPHADVVLVVGSRFVTLRALLSFHAPQAKFIYLNIDARDTQAPRQPGIDLIGDAAIGLTQLETAVKKQDRLRDAVASATKVRQWCGRQLDLLGPQMSWINALRRAIPDDGILINELTQVGYVAPLAYPVYAPRTFITPGYQGTLGYGMPTGLGAAVGNPDKVTVAISGDGGFGWNLQELATAAKYSIPLIMVVFVDGAFGNVRRIQQEVFAREIGTQLHNPDFHKLADAFGVTAVRAATPEALEATIREAAAARRRGPLLIEVPVGEMPSPWHLINPYSKQLADNPRNPLGDPGQAD